MIPADTAGSWDKENDMRFGDYSRVTTIEDDAGIHAARRPADDSDEDRYLLPSDIEDGDWAIWLPHDCHEWVIAHGSADDVVATARQFVASVTAAIAHIESEAGSRGS